jgi:GTP-binding protein Era
MISMARFFGAPVMLPPGKHAAKASIASIIDGFSSDGELTDEPEEVLMAELIREAALEGVRDELPHSLAVVIDEISRREGRSAEQGDLIDVHAVLYVERDSQKGIVIGRGGARLKEVGSTARRHIERLLGTKVYLELRVKVAKNWQQDPKQLGRLGF